MGSLNRVVLVTIDTLRADHLGCYGYPRNTSPHLDRLAEEGLLFRHAFSPSSYTAPTHASLFTSRYPSYHSIGFTNGGGCLDRAGEKTLAELLRTVGFTTAAFVSTIVLRRSVGLDKGFDHYDDTLPAWELNRPSELRRLGWDTTAAALAWVLSKPFVSSVLLGANTMTQLDENLGAADLAIGREDLAALDEFTTPVPAYPNYFNNRVVDEAVRQAMLSRG